MTSLNTSTDHPVPSPALADGTSGARQPARAGSGCLLSLGLPADMATRVARGRPVLTLEPDQIAGSRLDGLQDAMPACLLLGPGMDAVEIIAALLSAGYQGPLTVVAPPLPDPRMVERELAAAASGVAVTLVTA